MKRSIFLLLAVAVISGLAGWAAAQVRNQHQAYVREEKEKFAKLVAEKEAKKLTQPLAELAREADAVEFWYGGRPGENKRNIRFTDPAWNERMAKVLASSSYFHRPSGALWISFPAVIFYKNGEELFQLMGDRLLGPAVNMEDYAIVEEKPGAILALVNEKQGTLPAEAVLSFMK